MEQQSSQYKSPGSGYARPCCPDSLHRKLPLHHDTLDLLLSYLSENWDDANIRSPNVVDSLKRLGRLLFKYEDKRRK
ncbi:unnamed protein product [Pieris macdunnoughi]|uniref:Uncharacterized protein n=1 Tax=Pieris macdunnoughi TaxID=345717 RepID=A0A821M4W9_9NEOP|nr:unnamed protein product [Pieris macdunnoughi]